MQGEPRNRRRLLAFRLGCGAKTLFVRRRAVLQICVVHCSGSCRPAQGVVAAPTVFIDGRWHLGAYPADASSGRPWRVRARATAAQRDPARDKGRVVKRRSRALAFLRRTPGRGLRSTVAASIQCGCRPPVPLMCHSTSRRRVPPHVVTDRVVRALAWRARSPAAVGLRGPHNVEPLRRTTDRSKGATSATRGLESAACGLSTYAGVWLTVRNSLTIASGARGPVVCPRAAELGAGRVSKRALVAHLCSELASVERSAVQPQG